MGGLSPRAQRRAPNESGVTSLGLAAPRSLSRMLLGEAQENEGHKTRDEEVGRPTTPPGACPESARMVYRARLITSRDCTAVFCSRRFLFRLLVWRIGGSIVQVVLSTLKADGVSTIEAFKSIVMLFILLTDHGLLSSQSFREI